MKAIVLASSLRTAGNFMPVLESMRARGDELELAWVPLGGAVGEDPASLGFSSSHVSGARTRADSFAYWQGIEDRLRQPLDLVLMDDMIHWPAQEMTALVRRQQRAPALVAFQHGLYQAWNRMNQEFLADYFLCFGRRHVHNFDPCHWPRVLPTGLAKLDRLEPQRSGSGGYILYVAQSAPDPSIIAPMLADLQQKTGLPVHIRPHPGHAARYSALESQFVFVAAAEDIVGQIARADWILTTHSSAVLEAMRMGVPAVLLPSFGLTDFGLFPGIAVDFLAEKVLSALNVHRNDAAGRQRFLAEHCGGMRRDSSARTLDAIDAIVTCGGDASARRELVASMGAEHPLNAIAAWNCGTGGEA